MILYDGRDINDVDFMAVCEERLRTAQRQIGDIRDAIANEPPGSYRYLYWTRKLDRAIADLEVPKATTQNL